MNRKRIEEHLEELANEGYSVECTPNRRWGRINDFQYPTGWSPQTAPLRIKFPIGYPRDYPDLFIPTRLTFSRDGYTDGDVKHRLPCDYNGLYKWCIEEYPWNPREDSVFTFIREVMYSFSYPWRENPQQHVSTLSRGDKP